jgi:dipeptidyl aminopeptidase/acylaminoacyl peptidase
VSAAAPTPPTRPRGARPGPLLALVAALATACGSDTLPSVVPPPLRLVVSEGWNGGTRLVLLDERGDRWAVVSAGRGGSPTRDEQATFSPDGRWLAFVSSRGRPVERTSLWLMPAAAGATAVRVTDGRGDDVDPTWTPDGAAVVFARRTDATFALYRVAIAPRAGGLALGPLERLVDGPRHHLAPSVAPSGDLAYQEIDLAGSRIAVRAPDGSVTFATDGPADATPAWRPGGGLAFARRVPRPDGTADLDLWFVTDDGAPRSLAELPGSDESGPRWSVDGRWLFATAIARDVDGEVPSVVYLDVARAGSTPRMLRDQVGAIPRQGPAPAPVVLDGAALAEGPPFVDALDRQWRERAFARASAAAAADAAADAGL